MCLREAGLSPSPILVCVFMPEPVPEPNQKGSGQPEPGQRQDRQRQYQPEQPRDYYCSPSRDCTAAHCPPIAQEEASRHSTAKAKPASGRSAQRGMIMQSRAAPTSLQPQASETGGPRRFKLKLTKARSSTLNDVLC